MDDVYNQIKEEASEMEQSPEQPPFQGNEIAPY